MDRSELAARTRVAEVEANEVKRALPHVYIESPSDERKVTRFGKRKVERVPQEAWDDRRRER